MTIKRALAAALAATIAISGVTVSLMGCNKDETEEDEDEGKKKKKKKDDDEDEDKDKDKEEDADDGDVKRYPNMIRSGGTYILGKTYHVYQAADLSSKQLTSLARGTLVNSLYRRGGWIMVDWPAGPGQLKPGWVHEQWGSTYFKRQVIDAGIQEVDAGKPVEVDAGKPVEVDAGKKIKIKPKLRMPHGKH